MHVPTPTHSMAITHLSPGLVEGGGEGVVLESGLINDWCISIVQGLRCRISGKGRAFSDLFGKFLVPMKLGKNCVILGKIRPFWKKK